MSKLSFSVPRALILFFLALFSLAGTFVFGPPQVSKFPSPKTISPERREQSAVLGARTPVIFISNSGNGYAGGGLISLASTDEPAVRLGGYGLNHPVEVTIYRADQNAIFDYLTHDREGKQTIKPDLGTFSLLATTNVTVSNNGGTKVTLPESDTNVWFIRAKFDQVIADSVIVRSGFGVLTKQGDNEIIFWGQDYATGRSLSGGEVRLVSFQDSRHDLSSAAIGSDGIAKLPVNPEADIALATVGGDFAIVPLNLRYLNIGYSYSPFVPKSIASKFFSYTDRPLYRPGDKIYFRSIIRNDDDARYTIPKGVATVKFFVGGSDRAFFEKTLTISSDGTVFGEVQLPEDAATGYYSMIITRPGNDQSYTSFNVEYFRKPEYSIDVAIPQTEYISGDKPAVEVSGNYFSGQPLTGGQVKFRVYSSNYYNYGYWNENQIEISSDYRYGFWGGEEIESGSGYFDSLGKVSVSLDTQKKHDGHNKVYSFEANYDSGSGNPAFSRKNLIVFAGEFNIFRKEGPSSVKVNSKIDLPIILVPNTKTKVNSVKLTAKVIREEWVHRDDPNSKYGTYEKIEEDMGSLSSITDKNGNAVFSLTPSKSGYYRFSVGGIDQRGNDVIKEFGIYVTDKDYAYYTGGNNNDLTITADKNSYLPYETARLSISSTIPNRDVFLSLERGRLNRYQVLHLTGRSTQVDLPLVSTDTPNIFAVVSSFSKEWLNTNIANILVPANHQRLKVSLTPDRTTYGPSDTVNLDIKTSDNLGNPVSADLGIWSVDKALFELVDDHTPNIFNAFWSERWNGTQTAHSLEGISSQGGAERGGCFVTGTKILMADGQTKPIEQVKAGDFILTRSENSPALVKAKVTGVHQTSSDGYLVVNGFLRVTPNHIIKVNDTWQEAALVKTGDTLTDDSGRPFKVFSLEWLGLKADVHNLEVDKYHTYFADGVWVHNQKGGSRSIFKDTAYWNPSFHTDVFGKGRVTFKLPDNLTTWVIAAVADTQDTKVGQTTTEVTVSQDVIIRPTLPNIVRTGDDITLSALVQNFTDADHRFNVSFDFDSGTVKNSKQVVTVRSKESVTVSWETTVTKENEKAKLTFAAKSKSDPKASDSITIFLPARPFGFTDQRGLVGNGPTVFDLKIDPDTNIEKSTATLYLSPTILGTLPAAMNYLIGYPYGCVEQTVSRLIPAVIAKLNRDIYANAVEGKDLDGIIDKSVRRLGELQQGDGGWSWWWSGRSDPFITSYVLEYLRLAKSSGSSVPDTLIERGKNFLTYFQAKNNSEAVLKIYGLSLFGTKVQIPTIDGLNADILSLAVLANANNGDKNPNTNGLTQLLTLARSQGDGLYWPEGTKPHFSSVESSSALAIRAIIAGGGDRSIAIQAANYLMRNRRNDYWSNTFGTAQVVRAITDLAQTDAESTPDYKYSVSQDGKVLKSGSISDAGRIMKPIPIPLIGLKGGETSLSLTQVGQGQLYSNLVVKQFHTDKLAKAVDNGLRITRQYRNDRGDQYPLAVGDTVTVVITVDGLTAPENYAVIEDNLPSGLIPINTGFKNEQANLDPNAYYSYFGVSDRDYTENGVVMSLFRIDQGAHEYTYKARVVSAGTFAVPPATASLMYAPEISGRSAAEVVKIAGKPALIPADLTSKLIITGALAAIIITLIGLAFFFKKFRK